MSDYSTTAEPDEATIIRSDAAYEYCPICGNNVVVKEFEVKPGEKNHEVRCSNHGTLIHK